MHDLLLDHQDALRPSDLARYAGELDLDLERFRDRLRRNTGAARVAEDVDSADLSGVSGTRRSSSTDGGTTAPTTSPPFRRRYRPPEGAGNEPIVFPPDCC
jgi:hypothetical protein